MNPLSKHFELKRKLIAQALKKHPGEILKYCGDQTNWEGCFVTYDYKEPHQLAFFYNLESGHTFSEIMDI